MPNLRVCLCLSAVVLIAVSATAQLAPPKPGPELKRLAYFKGTWTVQGDAKPNQYGPGGKMTETEANDWMQGGFFLLCHVDFKSAMGDGTGLSVMGFNPDEKVYTYDSFNSWGEAEHATGTVTGDTWTWLSESKMMGKATQTRFTIKEGSPESYTFKFEMTGPEGAWKTVMDGTATKNK
jgi:hypothetical protein